MRMARWRVCGGKFGDEYISTELDASNGRRGLDTGFARHQFTALESWLGKIGESRVDLQLRRPRDVCGVDINARALERLRPKLPE